MKKPIIIPFILTFFVSVFFTSCDESDPVLDTSSREAFITSIAQAWTIDEGSHISINDQDVTHLLVGFEISIAEDLSYTSNSDQLTVEEFPWPTSGSFELNEELTELTRDDGLVITLNLTDEESSLELNFEADENTAGRVAGIIGGWTCKFKKKP